MEKCFVLNSHREEFINKETGEVVDYCVTTLGKPVQSTDKFVGYMIEELTGKGTDFNVIKNYVGKNVEVDLVYKKVDRKNYRAKLAKIEDVTL